MKKQFAVSDKLTNQDMKAIRKKLGLTQSEFSAFVNVSVKTIERWESGEKNITGPIVLLVKILNENPKLVQELAVPEKNNSIRVWYMCKNEVCTIIDVDERFRNVQIYNYTKDIFKRAFGVIDSPTFEQYEEFMESRCFPRDKIGRAHV